MPMVTRTQLYAWQHQDGCCLLTKITKPPCVTQTLSHILLAPEYFLTFFTFYLQNLNHAVGFVWFLDGELNNWYLLTIDEVTYSLLSKYGQNFCSLWQVKFIRNVSKWTKISPMRSIEWNWNFSCTLCIFPVQTLYFHTFFLNLGILYSL